MPRRVVQATIPAGHLLEKWLTEHGHTCASFARSMGASPSLVRAWMRGVKTPNLGHAIEVADTTGIPPRDWLVSHEGATRPTP